MTGQPFNDMRKTFQRIMKAARFGISEFMIYGITLPVLP